MVRAKTVWHQNYSLDLFDPLAGVHSERHLKG